MTNIPENNLSEHLDKSVFGKVLEPFVSNIHRRGIIRESQLKFQETKSLEEYYEVLVDAYKCLQNFSPLTSWFISSIYPKIFSDEKDGSRVPLPFWGGKATLILGSSIGHSNPTFEAYSIVTPKGQYFGTPAFDNERVIIWTDYPDSRIYKSESNSVVEDKFVIVTWDELLNMEIGKATERFIDWDWAGSEERKKVQNKHKVFELIGRTNLETEVWETEKWMAYRIDPRDENLLRKSVHYGPFNSEHEANILATAIGGEVSPVQWTLGCKCGFESEPFFMGIPECPKCKGVMTFRSGYKIKEGDKITLMGIPE